MDASLPGWWTDASVGTRGASHPVGTAPGAHPAPYQAPSLRGCCTVAVASHNGMPQSGTPSQCYSHPGNCTVCRLSVAVRVSHPRAWVGSSWRITGARSWPRPSVVLCVPCSIGPTTLPPASISKRAATLCGGGSDGALLRRASLACVAVANCLGWCAAACVWSVMPPRPLLEHGQHGKRIACDAW